MRTSIRKQLRVRYPSAVARCERRLRVLPPLERAGQKVDHIAWECDPPPDEQSETVDAFGNRVLELSHRRIARELHFTLELEVSFEPRPVSREMNLPTEGVGAFRLASGLCDAGPRVLAAWERAKVPRLSGRNVPADEMEAVASQLCLWTHRNLRYEPSQDIAQGAAGTLTTGTGMCAEFVHVMIALCRLSGVPTRYVSGFNPAEGLMHAWVETLCGECWLPFDPTHGRAPSLGSVGVAWGRDARDTAPHEGSYLGLPGARLQTLCRTSLVT